MRISPLLGRARNRRAELWQAVVSVEAACARPLRSPDWGETVRDALGELADGLAFHIEEVEGPVGLLAEVMERAPRLAQAATRLRQDHRVLTAQLADIVDQIEELRSPVDADRASAVRERAPRLLRALVRHRQYGADLVYEAYCVDIGGG